MLTLIQWSIHLFYDKESYAAVAARKQTLEKVAKEKMLIAGAHIPFPGLGTNRQ